MAADDYVGAIAESQHQIVAGAETSDHAIGHGVIPECVVSMLVHVEHRLRHRHLDVLSHAGCVPLVERGEHGDGRLERGVDVGMGVAVIGVVPAAGVTLGAGQAGFGSDYWGVGPSVGPWARCAVAVDRDVDEFGTQRPKVFNTEAEPIHHTGPEVFEDDVAGRDETLDDGDRLRS